MEEPKSLLSPNVATLGSFREPEVALYTGTPSISIPLFEIPLQDYVLPIELQYNGTSILVDQPPSWVGLGWNLSAGGVITRKVNDWPDDRRYTVECNSPNIIGYPQSGYYYNYFSLTKDLWYEYNKWQDRCTIAEPDEFQFSFMGYNGHFFLNHERKWVVQCDKSVSVELIPTTIYPPFSIPQTGIYAEGFSPYKKQPACFAGFIITIENGTQFIFGNDTSAIDFCTDFFERRQIMTANAWHLTKIVLPNKNEITFSYQRQSFTNQMYCNFASLKGTSISEEGNLECHHSEDAFQSSLWSVKGMLLSPVYLRRINTPTLSIEFCNSISSDLQYRKIIYEISLMEMDNDNDNDGYYMPYVTNFTYDYEGGLVEHYWDAISNNLKRYKLDSILITSRNNLSRNITFQYVEDDSIRLSLANMVFSDGSTYHFDYNDVSGLPHYLSFKSDHWGYYNNISSEINYASDTLYYYSKRQPDSFYSRKGLLSRICYPTGAVTKLEYESNDYQQQVAEKRWDHLIAYESKQYGGGVRVRTSIQKITLRIGGHLYLAEYQVNHLNTLMIILLLCLIVTLHCM